MLKNRKTLEDFSHKVCVCVLLIKCSVTWVIISYFILHNNCYLNLKMLINFKASSTGVGSKTAVIADSPVSCSVGSLWEGSAQVAPADGIATC
jgi:hypothetical protein